MLNIEHRDIEEINSKTVKIRVLGKGKKEKFITIEKSFIKEIKKIFEHETLLFCTVHGAKYNRRYVWRLVRERFKRVLNMQVHPHMLRHFFITYKIVVEKMDIKAVSKYAGHSDGGITLNMYVDNALDIDSAKMDI